MYGQYLREMEEQASNSSWLWLQGGALKPETERLITTAQEQALHTNYRRARIEKDGTSPKFRECKSHDETVRALFLRARSSHEKNTRVDTISSLRLCTGDYVRDNSCHTSMNGTSISQKV